MKKQSKLYIQLYNIHGLIRGHDLELGHDVDTGGQTKYVLEFAKTLSERESVEKVEIVTRLVADKTVAQDYAQPIEKVNDKLSIIRIKCGGSKYIRKEQIWDHLEEFGDKTIKYIKSVGRLPDIIHSHYADAGYVGATLTRFFGVPLIHTGHSLGRMKKKNLEAQNLTEEEIERKYAMSKRIRHEEDVIFYADRIISSTTQEAEEQYGMYENTNPNNITVLPPGIDLSKFYAYNYKREWTDEEQVIRNSIRAELYRFFTNMNKPLILSLCRPEKKKNIGGLIKAFGESEELQKKANLAIFAGIRKDIQTMPEIESEVLTEMLLLLDKYNLYGKMAIPKKHDFQNEVPELYRIAAETKGIFVNSAFSENFGLTLIEAACSGLPIVATDDGGPRDIISNLHHGLLVDVSDSKNIEKKLLEILDDQKKWEQFSFSGIDRVDRFYSWEAHTDNYLNLVNEVLEEDKEKEKTFVIKTGKKLLNYEKMMFFDIDDTMTGDSDALAKLNDLLTNNLGSKIGWGVSTGRTIDAACEVLDKNGVKRPDVIVSSVGSEIYYNRGEDYVYSTSWAAHIKNAWKPDRILELLEDCDFIELQDNGIRDFKVSYNLIGSPEELYLANDILIKNNIKTNLIVSHGKFIDFLPFRASKGRAIRYLSYRWNIPHEKILVAGDSGNDQDMLTGELLGVIVGNHTQELADLKGRRRVYFAENKFAAGIIEGIQYYKFLD